MNKIKKEFKFYRSQKVNKTTYIKNKNIYINKMYKNFHSKLFDYQDYLNSTNISNITIDDDSVIFTTRDNQIKLHCIRGDIRNLPFEIINFLDVEKKELTIINKLLPSNSIILDIGANIGFHSLSFSLDIKNLVYSFEPVPEIFSFLNRNIKINNRKNIKVFNFGFSDFNGESVFYFNESVTGNSSLKKLNSVDKFNEITCNFVTLDSFTSKENFAKIDFIKCDVEGAELSVFKGALKTLKKYKPIVFSEILNKYSKKFNYDPNEIFSLLKNLNYSSFELDENGNLIKFSSMNKDTISTNFFFLHNTKHRDLIDSCTY